MSTRGPTYAVNIVPADDEDLTPPPRGIHLGFGGDLRVTMLRGQVVTFSNMAAGWHVIRVRRIWATGSTASGITVVW